MRHGVIQVVHVMIIMLVISLKLKYILHLSLELLVLLYLFLLVGLLLDPLLYLVLLFDSIINDVPLLFESSDPFEKVHVLEVTACLCALEVKTPFLSFSFWLFPINISVIQHVNPDKVSHLVVHFFTIAKLECEILVFFILM